MLTIAARRLNLEVGLRVDRLSSDIERVHISKGREGFDEKVVGGIDDDWEVVGVGRGAQDVTEDRVVYSDEVEQGDVVGEG